MKLLVIALSGIGDALMFTPPLTLLKKQNSTLEIDALVMYKGVQDIYNRTGFFNQIYYFDFLNASKLSSLKFVLSLRKKYTHSINVYPSNRKEYNLIQFLIGAGSRGGVKYLRSDLSGLGFLNNLRILENDSLHNVQENVALISKMFNINSDSEFPLVFNLLDQDIDYSNRFFLEHQISDNELIVGFHPGCSTLKNHIMRRWEPDKFAALAKFLIEKNRAKVLVFGGPEETELKNQIVNLTDKKDIISVNTNNLAQTAAIIKKCSLFVTNDSSLMHVAASQSVKTYAIIGPTNKNYIHPWKTAYEVISLDLTCSPCFIYSPAPLQCGRSDIKYKCIKELSPEFVYSKLQIKN